MCRYTTRHTYVAKSWLAVVTCNSACQTDQHFTSHYTIASIVASWHPAFSFSTRTNSRISLECVCSIFNPAHTQHPMWWECAHVSARRLYIVFVSAEIGGEKALKWMENYIQERTNIAQPQYRLFNMSTTTLHTDCSAADQNRRDTSQHTHIVRLGCVDSTGALSQWALTGDLETQIQNGTYLRGDSLGQAAQVVPPRAR